MGLEALWIMTRNVLVFVALAIPGFILVKTKLIKQEQSGVLSAILMYVGIPFLILNSMLNNVKFDVGTLGLMGSAAAVGIGYTLVMFFLSKPLTKMEKEEKTKGIMRFCMTFPNNGFLGIPLAMAVFGAGAKEVLVVIIINIINNVSMYAFGVCLISRDRKSINLKKIFLNPALIAFALGVILNLLKVKDYVPEVGTYTSHFSNMVTPVSMTVLGMKMGSVNFSGLLKSWRMYYVSLWKLVLFPMALVVGLFLLSQGWIAYSALMGMFIAFAMPTAGLASTFSDKFNGDTENAVAFTLGTTLLSIVTIPLLYALLNVIL